MLLESVGCCLTRCVLWLWERVRGGRKKKTKKRGLAFWIFWSTWELRDVIDCLTPCNSLLTNSTCSGDLCFLCLSIWDLNIDFLHPNQWKEQSSTDKAHPFSRWSYERERKKHKGGHIFFCSFRKLYAVGWKTTVGHFSLLLECCRGEGGVGLWLWWLSQQRERVGVWRRRGKVTQLVEYRWYPSMNMTEDLISILPAWVTYGGSGEYRMFRGACLQLGGRWRVGG